MRMNIFYFSGTGNTLWAVETLCTQLKERNIDANGVSIEKLSHDDMMHHIMKSDAIGLAWPIYGSDLPENMKTFIRALPEVDKKPLLTLCTQYLFSGDGAYVMHHTLQDKGYVYRWCYQLNMPSNINMYPIYFKSSDDYDYHETKRLKKAYKDLTFLATKIANNKSYVKGATIFHTMAAMLQRPLYRLGQKKFVSGWLQVTPTKCTECGICVQNCPTQNINMVNDLPVFKNACLLCLRCYDFCPTTAITGKGHKHNFKFGPPFKGPTKEIYQRIIKDHKA